MQYKTEQHLGAGEAGRGKESLTRKNFSKRRQRGGFAKKGMAYFLSFLMLAGNLQSVSYAEEIAGETVERIALATEEKSSESLREREEKKEATLSSEEKAEERKTSLEETALEKEESKSEGKKEKKEELASEETNKTAPSEAKTEDSSLEEKDSLSSEEAKQEEKPEYMDAGSFEASYGKDITVLASYSEGTFFEGTRMKVVPVDSESILEEAKALSQKDYKKKNPGEEAEVEVLEAIDISFYREVNGVEKEVQPKNGKKVELRLQKSKKIKDALAKTEENFKEDQEEDFEEELQIVHLSEDHPGEILSVKEEGEELLFSAKHFSPIILVRRTRDLGEEAVNHEFKAFWTEAPNAPRFGSTIPNGHTYTDGSNGVMREQRDLTIVPPGNASNGTDTTTLGIELTLKGNKNVSYEPGTVSIDVPARIFEGWDENEPNKLSVYEKKEGNQYKLQPSMATGLLEAPKTDTQSSFNYTIIKKNIPGKDKPEDYLRLTNYRAINGGFTFKADIAYNLTPTMLKVKHDDTKGVGVYDNNFPVSLNIDHSDNSLDVKQDVPLSVHVETKVEPTRFNFKHGEADSNQGLFFAWDPSWGKTTDKAGEYFYGVWYLRVDRARGSSQPFDYTFHTLDPADSDGGILVGAKKLPTNAAWNVYFYKDNIENFARNGYADIAKFMGPGENPPATQPFLENPIGRSYVGIPKDPSVDQLPIHQPYAESLNYANDKYNSQLYALLYKYPISKLQEAKDKGLLEPGKGLEIKNKIAFTETWADGYVRNGEAEAAPMKVFLPSSGPGDFLLKKYNTVDRQSYLGIFGLQSIYKEGTAAPVIYSNWNESFTLSSSYKAKDSSVNVSKNGSYTTSSDPAVPGSGTTITDGKYKLFSVKPRQVDGKTLKDETNEDEFSSDSIQNGDVHRGDIYELKEGDYHYSRIDLRDSKVYDVDYLDNPLMKFAGKASPRKKDSSYPPVQVWVKDKRNLGRGYFEYGRLSYKDNGGVIFTVTEPGAIKKNTVNDYGDITRTNQLDLEAAFGDNIVGLQLKQDSPYYKTSFDVAFTIKVTPQPAMRAVIADTMARGDGYNINFLAGGAVGEVRQLGTAVINKRAGKYLAEIGYGLEPLNINSELVKQNKPYVDHPERGEQSMDVIAWGFNWGTFPSSLQGDEFTKPYVLKSGIIYDLLPAGTYVDESSIVLGTWDAADTPPDSKKYVKGKDYTVEFHKNWKKSGQTMMKIEFTIPDDADHRFWNKLYNRSGWKLNYTLWNPYTNIVDRGRTAKNTLGFVNTDENTVWKPNYNPKLADPGNKAEKIEYYKELALNALNSSNDKYTTSVTELNMPYGPVTVLEARFSNTVSTEIDPRYLSSNVSYMGDPYTHRLMYQASDNSRTTDLVIYDILGEKDKRNGDFNGVDIDSLLSKRSFDKDNANNQDTLKPRVFYSYEIPTEAKRDLGKAFHDPDYNNDTNPNNPRNTGTSIWREWNYEDETQNIGVEKDKIVALAFDLRTTKYKKPFILDKKGLLIANVNMLAHTDMDKVSVVNTNLAYRVGTLFPGNDIPQNVAPDIVEGSSSHRLVEPVVFKLPVKKILDVPKELATQAPDIRGKFTFTISGENKAPLLDEKGNPITTVLKNPDKDGGTVEFGNIRLMRPGTYTYKINEHGASVDGVTSEDMGDKFITITVTDPDNKKMVSDLRFNSDNPLTFTNVFGDEIIEAEIKVQKFLSATAGIKKPDISNAFTFTLKSKNGAPMPLEAGTSDSLSKTNPDAIGGEVNFGRVKIAAQGDYEYTVTESGLFPGVNNDPRATRNVTIKVRRLDGKLYALVGGDDFNYTNVFTPTPTQGQVELGKKISGRKPSQADPFRFVLRTETMEISSNSVYWTDKREDPIFNDKEIFFNNGNGNDTFEEYLDPDNNLIRNKKIVSNSDLEEGVLYGSSGLITEVKPSLRSMPKGLFQPMPEGSQSETEMVVIAGEGHTEFAPITFHVPGKYVYTVKELKDGINGYTYDNTVYTVVFTVTQSNDSKETLMVSRKIYKNGAEVSEILFDNKYNPYRPGGGGGTPNRPSFPTPNTPGGPGEPPAEPEKPTLPEEPKNPTPDNGNSIPPSPTVPRTIEEIQKRIGEILGAGRKRPLTPEEEAELKHLGEVLGALRRSQSRKVNTADASHLLWYAFASALSFSLLSIYYFLRKLRKKR
ncbi:Spy0128 family protein [Oribacterium sp.]